MELNKLIMKIKLELEIDLIIRCLPVSITMSELADNIALHVKTTHPNMYIDDCKVLNIKQQ